MSKIIVVDGLDGCGKATQTKLLEKELKERGYDVHRIEFPKYDSDSSAAVRMYLNGELGDNAEEISPYVASSFYAIDRIIQYYTDWKKFMDKDDNTVIIADRYLSANIIHQGAKISDIEDRHKFIEWCYDIECNKNKLPKDDITIILAIDAEISQRLLSERYHGHNEKKDIHESNVEYLKKCYELVDDAVDYINESNIANWKRIECTTNGELDTVEVIHNRIMEIVDKVLA